MTELRRGGSVREIPDDEGVPKTLARPIALWMGPNADPLIKRSTDLSPFRAVGVPYRKVSHHRTALAEASKRGLARYIDLESWREQYGASHPSHPVDEISWSKRAYNPDAQAMSDALAEEIAEQQVDALVAARADWLATPGHVVAEGHSLSLGRRNEIKQAHAFADVARSRGPQAVDVGQRQRPRRVLATIAIRLAGVQNTVLRDISAAYGEVDCDAYILRAWCFGPSKPQFLAVRRLAHDLQEATGRRCIVEGLKHMTYGALRNEISGAVVGYGRGVLNPTETAKLALQCEAEERRTGKKPDVERTVLPYAPTILASLAAGDDYKPRRIALLRELNCSCGAHSPDSDVHGIANQLVHNFECARQELHEAIAPPNLPAFAQRLDNVRARRRLAGLSELEAGWHAVFASHRPAQRVRPQASSEL